MKEYQSGDKVYIFWSSINGSMMHQGPATIIERKAMIGYSQYKVASPDKFIHNNIWQERFVYPYFKGKVLAKLGVL